RGGAIFWSALPSDKRQVQADMRTHLSRATIIELIEQLLPTPTVPLAIDESEAADQSQSKAVH
ncbi:MAG: hypothetical protein WAK67_08140, partial [Xanthobacteraceae bacterium]